jgi:superfamily II DNA/RNA helicase
MALPKKPKAHLEFVKFAPTKNTITAKEVRQKTRELIISANQALDTISSKDNRIALIQAPTGSGKTHSILEEIKVRDLQGKVAIAIPTRANVFNLSQLTDSLDIGFGTHVGGEDGEDKVETDIGTIYTYGKLYEVIKNDPLLSEYNELILDEADMITHGYETRWIPYLTWLLKTRPELKIILLSATLDIEGFQKIFKVSNNLIFKLEELRPRPITHYYLSENDSEGNGLILPFTASKYIAVTIKAIEEQLTGKNKMIGGEAVIVFMPTISSVNKVVKELKLKFGEEMLDIRTLHSRIDREDIEAGIKNPVLGGKIGVMVATDIIGRGINFGNELRINRVIHSGLVNQRVYNNVIRRDILQVNVASHNEVKQAIGRAGRHIDDGREVIGICLMPFTQLKQNLATRLRDTDPTMMILQSIVVYNSIIRQRLIIHETLLEYISNVDINKKLVKQSLKRLLAIGAVNEFSEITDLGRFLASCNIEPDYGLMLYQINQDKYDEFCDALALVMRSYSLVDHENRELFNGAILSMMGQKKIKSDFDIYKQFVDLIPTKEDAEMIGVNYNMYLEALRTAKNLRNLKEVASKSQKIIDKPLIINNLIKFVGTKNSKYGEVHEYLHIASDTICEVDKYSIIYIIEPPKYAFAFNISLLGDRYVASELVSVTAEELLKYNDPLLVHEDLAMLNYDALKGTGNYDIDIIYKGYFKDIKLFTHNITFSSGEKCYQGLAQYLIPKLPRAFKNLAKRIEIANHQYNADQIIYETVMDYLRKNDITTYQQGFKPIIDISRYNLTEDQLPPSVIELGGLTVNIDYIKEIKVIDVKIENLLKLDTIFDDYYINTNVTKKPVYRTVRSVRKVLLKKVITQAQSKALKQAKRKFLGNKADINKAPILPKPIEFYQGYYIYPYFTITSEGDIYTME